MIKELEHKKLTSKLYINTAKLIRRDRPDIITNALPSQDRFYAAGMAFPSNIFYFYSAVVILADGTPNMKRCGQRMVNRDPNVLKELSIPLAAEGSDARYFHELTAANAVLTARHLSLDPSHLLEDRVQRSKEFITNPFKPVEMTMLPFSVAEYVKEGLLI